MNESPNPPIPDPPSAPPVDLATLGLAQWPQFSRRLSHWSEKRQSGVKRVWSGHGSPRNAVKFMCLECTGESVDAIATCADRFCPLWMFRPFQPKQQTKGQNER